MFRNTLCLASRLTRLCYSTVSSPRSKWEPWEDDLIRDFVQKNGRHFRDLAAHCLPHRTANALEQRWTETVDPAMRRGGFSKQEIATLKKAVDTLGPAWAKIRDQYLPDRTVRALHYNYIRHCQHRVNGSWTDTDDALLLKGYAEHGRQWTVIANKYLPHRTGGSCRERYDESLDPNVNSGRWSSAEHDWLLRRIIMYGQDWEKVAEGLPGRTKRACRRVFIQRLEPSLADNATWSGEDNRLFWYMACEHNCDWVKVGRAVGKNPYVCSLKFRRDIQPMKPILGSEVIEQRQDENRHEWKLRVARAMRDWIDSKSRVRVKPGGGLTVANTRDWTKEELHVLKEATKDKKDILWHDVTDKVGKTEAQCRYKYDQLSHPNVLSWKPWTEQEDTMLEELVQKHGTDWTRVTRGIDGRSKAQCMYRWHQHLKHRKDDVVKGHFSQEEKDLVREGVNMFGNNWTAIAKTYLPHRTPEQCMRSYQQSESKTGLWTKEEDEKLRFAVSKFGEASWKDVASLVPTRNSNQCRVRWLRAVRPDVKQGRWSAEEQVQLAELVQRNKSQNDKVDWNQVALELQTGRSSWSCRSKYNTMAQSGNRFGLRTRAMLL